MCGWGAATHNRLVRREMARRAPQRRCCKAHQSRFRSHGDLGYSSSVRVRFVLQSGHSLRPLDIAKGQSRREPQMPYSSLIFAVVMTFCHLAVSLSMIF